MGVDREVKLTRHQLRRLIREQVEPDCGESVGRKRLDMSLDDTGPHMKNAVIRAVMKVINTYRCMTSTTDLNPEVQAYRAEQRRKAAEESEESEADLKSPEKHWTFEQYVDFALDDIKAKVFGGDYSVPRDMVGMREVKVSRNHLQMLIREELVREMMHTEINPTSDYGVGDIIMFRPWRGDPVKVRVTGRTHVDHIDYRNLTDEQYRELAIERNELAEKGIYYDDVGIKNNLPGFDGIFF